MKVSASLRSCLLIAAVMLCYRCYYSDLSGTQQKLFVTQWDAFGYYLYLPATLIYHDYDKLDWADSLDRRYHLGGDGLPVVPLTNGNRVCKYLGGVALMQAPLFAAGHIAAKLSGAPQDGFSPPYQYALAVGALLYCILSLFLLRRMLCRYFSDAVVAATLVALCLATNFTQYSAVTAGLSHCWIFVLYVLILWATIKWHESPRPVWALLCGFLVGWATISRPTEAIALFIPLLWQTQTREAARSKWALVKTYPLHVLLAAGGGLAGVLPQLLYWKAVTGSYIYDVGSKWAFFNPWWRVLIGWEKGWFIYTPVTIFFVAGLLCMKPYPFRKAALTFILLNIWIVISWDDWRYGGSYATRALVQSYPVFALSLGALIQRIWSGSWRPAAVATGMFLCGVNLFQTLQYNSTILHYNDMNRRYYSRIYLNPSPTALDMSLLDNSDYLESEQGFRKSILLSRSNLLLKGTDSVFVASLPLSGYETWFRIDARIAARDAY